MSVVEVRAVSEVARAKVTARIATLSGLARESLYKAINPAALP